MAMPETILEGVWEEIEQEHAGELAGRRVRVTVLADDSPAADGSERHRQAMLAWLDAWERAPITEGDRRVLDDFEMFEREYRAQVLAARDRE